MKARKLIVFGIGTKTSYFLLASIIKVGKVDLEGVIQFPKAKWNKTNTSERKRFRRPISSHVSIMIGSSIKEEIREVLGRRVPTRPDLTKPREPLSGIREAFRQRISYYYDKRAEKHFISRIADA